MNVGALHWTKLRTVLPHTTPKPIGSVKVPKGGLFCFANKFLTLETLATKYITGSGSNERGMKEAYKHCKSIGSLEPIDITREHMYTTH